MYQINGLYQTELIKDSGIIVLYKYTRVNLYDFMLDSVNIAKGRRTKVSLACEKDYIAWAHELRKHIGGHVHYNESIIKNQ